MAAAIAVHCSINVATLGSSHPLQHERSLQDGNGPFYFWIAIFAFAFGIFEATFAKPACYLFNAPTCICRESGLRRFLQGDILQGNICSNAQITVSEPLDMTGRNFTLNCNFQLRLFQEVDYQSCVIQTNGNVDRIFQGAPVQAKFENILFSAEASGGIFGIGGNQGGGGLFDLRGGDVTFLQTRFHGAATTDDGGALQVSGADTSVEMGLSRFDGNSARNGGAISVTDGAYVELRDVQFRDNTASNDGGAIYINRAQVNVEFTAYFLNNQAESAGGAIASYDSDVLLGTSTRFFEGNEAGGAVQNIFIPEDTSDLSNVTCTDNEFISVEFCGELGINNGSLDKTNCDELGAVVSFSSFDCDPDFVNSYFH